MNRKIARAREMLPTILLTVLSMIQALALELYWTKIGESEFLWQGGWQAVVGWLQLVIIFLGILLIWLIYVSTVLRFSWVPSMEDTVIPFFIGLLEFALIDLLDPELVGPWLVVFATVFAVSTAASHMAMRRARRDPANAYFFEEVEPAGWGDYSVSIAVISFLAGLGVLLWLSDTLYILSVAALLMALAALVYQFRQIHRYWLRSVDAEPQE